MNSSDIELGLKGVMAIGQIIAQVQGILAARAAGRASEEEAGAELDRIIAAASGFCWKPVTPPES